MAKRIFTSFAIEDKALRDFLKGQARNEAAPFEFTDMSVKEPWDNAWKTRCRTRIRGCHGVVAIVTMNTKSADGQLWEVKCAYDEGVPVYPIFGFNDSSKRPKTLPAPLGGKRVYNWTWPNIEKFIEGL
jgi:hypothetical protein